MVWWGRDNQAWKGIRGLKKAMRAINTRQPNQSAPFTKILAEPMNQIQETSSFSASSKARWRYADYFQFIAKPFQPQPGCVVLVPLSQPASERTTL